MAFLLITRSKGIDYYTIAESYRDSDGKVKRRRLEYIGNFEALKSYVIKGYNAIAELSASNTQTDKPPPVIDSVNLKSVKTYAYGACAAILEIAGMFEFEYIIDDCIGDDKTIHGHSRGELLVLAAIQRIIKPGSKRAFSRWAATTSLPHLAHFDPDELTSQAFWEAMDGIDTDTLDKIWNTIVKKIIDYFKLDIREYHLDYTNYFTFIDSYNERCLICKRGHNKQKRDDLRQFSLAVLTAFELQIPLIWHAYDGNHNDKTEFSAFTKIIATQLASLNIPLNEVTISFDGGSNSAENFKDLPFHIICSHSMASNPELLDIDIDKYEEIELANGKKRKAYRVDDFSFSGIAGTAVLTFSQELFDNQVNTLNKKLTEAVNVCIDINQRFKNPRSRLFTKLNEARETYERRLKDVIEYNQQTEKYNEERKSKKKKGRAKRLKPLPEWNEKDALYKIVSSEIYEGRKELEEFTQLWLTLDNEQSYTTKLIIVQEAKEAFVKKSYGKKMTCTDHKDWTTSRILLEYCEQECIENGVFKISKNIEHFAVRPQYHWTDEKICVHIFCCLLGMTMVEILYKLFSALGIEVSSKGAMIDTLNSIREGWLLIEDGNNRLVPKRFLEAMDIEQKKLWDGVLKIQELVDDYRKNFIEAVG